MFFSIVTVNYNNKKGLQETIKSVLTQTIKRDKVQFIVIDAGSNDGSVDVLEKNEDLIDVKVSEPNSGIFFAMNKTIALATGEWINFINAGDSFYDLDVLAKPLLNKTIVPDILYGRSMYVLNGNDIGCPQQKINHFYQGVLIGHQATFVVLELTKSNLCSLQYRVSGYFTFFFNIYGRL
jgi:glycosyltransferase involved in cell wall biosynthesis